MILFALALAAAQPAETPQQFIGRIYAGYRSRDYRPLDRLERLFAPELAAAIRTDRRLDKGEVGYLDGDPLCDCQDYQRITARVLSLRRPSARAASARVHVTLGPKEASEVRLSLVLTGAGWRIADLGSADSPSLLRALRQANRAAAAR
ncbi:MAG: DUF3828 domain-containing protein [Sphingomicrobium sp.]